MEESKKLNRKKKLPAIPSNFVTLLQLQERWMKGKVQKGKEKQENEEQRSEQGEENPVENQVNDEVAGRASRKKEKRHRYYRKNGKPKPKEEEMPAGFAVRESEGVEQKKEGEDLKKKKKKNKKKEKKKEKEEKAGAEDENEVGEVEVEGTSMDTAVPASVENCEPQAEKAVKDHNHALKEASFKAKRVFKRRNLIRPEDPTADIGRRFNGMSIKDGTRTRDYCRYGRKTGSFNHQRNGGMVWVKKVDASGGNAGGIQT